MNTEDEREAGDTGNEATREAERGDVAEPNAPTAGEENAGMNTILNPGAGTGVQDNANEE